MGKFNYLACALTVFLLAACSGSDTYRGDWKATDAEGSHFDITFEEKVFRVKQEDDKTSDFRYSQNSVNITNSIETYGIKLEDGRRYEIVFPIADDESVGVMKDGSGNVMFTISRSDYLTSEDIYRLN